MLKEFKETVEWAANKMQENRDQKYEDITEKLCWQNEETHCQFSLAPTEDRIPELHNIQTAVEDRKTNPKIGAGVVAQAIGYLLARANLGWTIV